MLWNKNGFTAKPNELQSIFILVDVASETPAGLYEGKIRIEPEGMPANQFDVQVKIWDFVLPDVPPVKTHFSGSATDMCIGGR